MAKEYNFEIATAIRDYLDSDDWHYRFNEGNGTFDFNLSLKQKIKNVRYLITVHEYDYTVYAISPISVEQDNAEQLGRMAEFICRANYGLRDGNWELDYNDGELRYKSHVNCSENLPTANTIRRSISLPAAMFDYYGNGIVQVLLTDISAKDAVALCENTPESNDEDESDEETPSDRLQALLHMLQSESESSGDDDPDVTPSDASSK